MSKYSYIKNEINIEQLGLEIRASTSIIQEFDYISCLGSAVNIFFKTDLFPDEIVALDNIVADHVPNPVVDGGEATLTKVISTNSTRWRAFYSSPIDPNISYFVSFSACVSELSPSQTLYLGFSLDAGNTINSGSLRMFSGGNNGSINTQNIIKVTEPNANVTLMWKVSGGSVTLSDRSLIIMRMP